MSAPFWAGDLVRIRRGVCGEGHAFRVAYVTVGRGGRWQVGGVGYGPVWADDVEYVSSASTVMPPLAGGAS